MPFQAKDLLRGLLGRPTDFVVQPAEIEQPPASPAPKAAPAAPQHRILLACAPKSGSSFLSAIFENLPDFHRSRLMSLSERREQELCPVMLERAVELEGNFVAQQHIRYSLMTNYYIKKYRLKPVVQVRSIFDLIVSFRDHIGGGRQRGKARRATYQPMAAVPEEYSSWSDDRQSEFVAKFVAPWYFNFYVNWIDCDEKILVTYEELIANPVATVNQIAQYWEIDVSEDAIIKAVAAAKTGKTRLNVGKSGRGDALPPEIRDHVLSLASFYEGVDLTPLGLTAK